MDGRIGERYGRLVIIQLLNKGKYFCKCDCGNEVTLLYQNVKTGNSKSCGCLNIEKRQNNH